VGGGDIASCFEAIPHDRLMRAVEERVSDQGLLKLLRTMLRAGVMDEGSVRRPVTGTRRVGWSRRCWRTSTCTGSTGHGTSPGTVCWPLCRRLGGDVPFPWQTEAALEQLRFLLAGLDLEPKPVKTRIVHLHVGGEGFDFLGFPIGWCAVRVGPGGRA
jgi:RNA-directed DNA polymerase